MLSLEYIIIPCISFPWKFDFFSQPRSAVFKGVDFFLPQTQNFPFLTFLQSNDLNTLNFDFLKEHCPGLFLDCFSVFFFHFIIIAMTMGYILVLIYYFSFLEFKVFP